MFHYHNYTSFYLFTMIHINLILFSVLRVALWISCCKVVCFHLWCPCRRELTFLIIAYLLCQSHEVPWLLRRLRFVCYLSSCYECHVVRFKYKKQVHYVQRFSANSQFRFACTFTLYDKIFLTFRLRRIILVFESYLGATNEPI